MRTSHSLIVRLILLLVLVTWPTVSHAADFDKWYVVLLQGQRTGWVHITQAQEDGRVISQTKMRVNMKRGAQSVAIDVESWFVETDNGKPVEATSKQEFGTMQITQTIRFMDDGIELISSNAGQTLKDKIPNPQVNWLPPAALQRFMEEQLAAGAKTFKIHTMDPTVGAKLLEMQYTVIGRENVEVFGKVVPAVVWDVQITQMPGLKTREYVDEKGHSIKSTMSFMPGMEFAIVEADKQLSTSELDPPEMMAATLVRPAADSKIITNPRQLRSALFELRFTNEDDGWTKPKLPSTGFQRVKWVNDHTARVYVDLSAPAKTEDDGPGEDYLSATTILNRDDPKITQLVMKAIDSKIEELSAAAKAERLRLFVNQYIDEKDLSVGFATAGEVARTGVGDCSEHAVLLAAMLRAADIPSRAVTGLIYVDSFLDHDEVFGYHMWTQAWLPDDQGNGRWLDLDAVISDSTTGGFDATHIALGHSALGDDAIFNDMVALAPTIGRLQIRVIEVSTNSSQDDYDTPLE